MINKVEICGVNTSKLPTLSAGEKRELFEKIKKGETVTDSELSVNYLRKPQAEREREERLAKEKNI